jgi:hypothetical protein
MKSALFFGATILVLLLLLISGTQSDHGVIDQLIAAVDDYQEECTNEGCSSEEVEELHESYTEECLHEGCSSEEIRELGGSMSGAEDMFADFRRRGWKVDRHCHTFNLDRRTSGAPTKLGTMTCKSPTPFTVKCEGLAEDGHRTEWTEYGFGGIPGTRTRCW